MIIDIINKVLIMIYVLSCLNTVRHAYYFIQAWVKSKGAEPTKYRMGNISLILLGLSLAYIISSIFIGIGI